MTANLVLQKRNASGYRRFIIKEPNQAKSGGTTGTIGLAMKFNSVQEAELFLSLNSLFGFAVVESDGTDDRQEEARAYWHRNKK
ncbi:MAG: hypothetical protein EBU84_02915 [Actinobacteria bacterium]|nr:hypothetical protein [Actinomycetota bacterium]